MSPAITTVRPGRAAEHLLGPHFATVGEGDRLAALQQATLGAERHTERIGRLDVEASRALVLDQRVTDRRDAVLDGKRHQAVVVAGERVAGTELPELVPVGELAEDPAQRLEQVDESRRAVNRDRHLAPTQSERLEHAGQPEVVVGVVVGQEDLAEVDQPERRPEQLALCALGAVEEQAFAAAADEQRGGRTIGRRHRAGRAEEDDVEVHGSKETLVLRRHWF